MKIRTDFVTNSSSSSFVAILDAVLENGKKIRAVYDEKNGGEATGEIVVRRANYRMDVYRLRLMDNLCDVAVNTGRETSRIVSGKLSLKCHTYGEYIWEAYPEELFSKYSIGDPWNRVKTYLSGIDTEDLPEQLIPEMKRDSVLRRLTDDSIRTILEYMDKDEIDSDTEIIQQFSSDGTESIEINNGEWLFDTNDDWEHFNKIPDQHITFSVMKDPTRYMQDCEERFRTIGSVEERIQYAYVMMKLGQRELLDFAVKNIDRDVSISFMDKHFATTGFGDDEEVAAEQIRKRGGFFHTSMVKKADYLVVCPEEAGTRKIEDALKWREQGIENHIILDYQFWQALQAIPAMDEKALKALEQERERQKQLEETEKQEAKRRKLEEKQKQKDERIAARKAEEERKQHRAAERAEAAVARRQAEEEKLAQKEEARLAKEAEKQEARRLAEEKKAKRLAEIEQARAEATVLYAPGEEPEPLRTNIKNLMAKLDEAYPDHVIVNLGKEHAHWDERVTELYRKLGYADRRSFLEAYGFRINPAKGGRPTTFDPDDIMRKLRERYPQGFEGTFDELRADNPDIPWRTLQNKSKELLGMSLVKYLKEQGLLKASAARKA